MKGHKIFRENLFDNVVFILKKIIKYLDFS